MKKGQGMIRISRSVFSLLLLATVAAHDPGLEGLSRDASRFIGS